MDPRPALHDQEPGIGQILLPLVGLVLILGLIGARTLLKPADLKVVSQVAIHPEPDPPNPPPSERKPKPQPPAIVPAAKPEAPKLNLVAVARAEERLAAAKRERTSAERKLAEIDAAIEKAQGDVAQHQALLQTLEERAKEASQRISAASAEGGRIQGVRDRLKSEVASIAASAKPRVKALLDKSPVARQIKGDEVHFEVRRNRVAPIELDQLVEMVKTDAKIRMRVGGIRGRPISATVGPIGSFALKYEIGLMMADGGDGVLDMTSIGYGLRGWELVPISEERGETLEEVVRPGSAYANAVFKLVPGKTSVTFWVYPDGFALYRRLRDDLHERGYLVAARPLPEGLPIQASPSGSASAAQ